MVKLTSRSLLVPLRRMLSRDSGRPLPERRLACPVCGSNAVGLAYKHTEFRRAGVRVCAGCGHGYTDRDYAFKASGLWSTTRERSEYHLAEVIPKWIRKGDGTFLEIGCCDFHFLTRLGCACPNLSLYGFDRYPIGDPPDGIRFTSDLRAVGEVDYVYSSHALEHIFDLDLLFELLVECLVDGSIFVVEVPNNSIEKHLQVRGGRHVAGYHFQFFNERSLELLCCRYGFESMQIYSYGPEKWGLQGMNLVGVFKYSGKSR